MSEEGSKQKETKQPDAKQPDAKQLDAKQPDAKQPDAKQPTNADGEAAEVREGKAAGAAGAAGAVGAAEAAKAAAAADTVTDAAAADTDAAAAAADTDGAAKTTAAPAQQNQANHAQQKQANHNIDNHTDSPNPKQLSPKDNPAHEDSTKQAKQTAIRISAKSAEGTTFPVARESGGRLSIGSGGSGLKHNMDIRDKSPIASPMISSPLFKEQKEFLIKDKDYLKVSMDRHLRLLFRSIDGSLGTDEHVSYSSNAQRAVLDDEEQARHQHDQNLAVAQKPTTSMTALKVDPVAGKKLTNSDPGSSSKLPKTLEQAGAGTSINNNETNADVTQTTIPDTNSTQDTNNKDANNKDANNK
eukprot:CAMPEP_0197541304 /NCGR_PEP_ID=MMETSP1318-20131121/67083_1 /TAXON_ID=552666 /ORGANISM="Partenskyella glossopodia, Strain RCC365" /LENGTH=356 /DNA_ID=CAMNT_0043100459 /DNA_START=355 /DNA_END=1422 /DNA_ORIENTATION=-